MNLDILRDITYGMYIVSISYENIMSGCVVNTITQITSENPIISVSINKNNYTNEILKKSKKIAISILSEETSKDTIVKFGYNTSREINKFEDINYINEYNVPIVNDNICGYIIGDIINVVDVETHDIFLIRIIDTKKISNNIPMTYSYYHNNLKGTSPKNAPTYIKENTNNGYAKYECIICGHIYDEEVEKVKFEDLPDDWKCPVCKVGKDKFKRIN